MTCTPRQLLHVQQKGQKMVLYTHPCFSHHKPRPESPSRLLLQSCWWIDEKSVTRTGISVDVISVWGFNIVLWRDSKWTFDIGVVEHMIYWWFSGSPNEFLQSEQQTCTLLSIAGPEDTSRWLILSISGTCELDLFSVQLMSTPNSILRLASLLEVALALWTSCCSSTRPKKGEQVDFLLFWVWELTLEFQDDSVSGSTLLKLTVASLSGVSNIEHWVGEEALL